MQPVDFTTFTALCAELRSQWLPARCEQVYQHDRFTVSLALRTLDQRGWLTISWHPQAARLHLDVPPPRIPDTFTFSQQLRHQLGQLALVAIVPLAPWERVVDLQFTQRPGDPVLWHLYVEVMGQYSNVILVNQADQIVTAAHQVSAAQSSVRPIQTGQPYEQPPALSDGIPTRTEDFDRWRSRVSLVPGEIRRTLIKTYRGLSSALVTAMVQSAEIAPNRSTTSLSDSEWQHLYQNWQTWLKQLETEDFHPGWTEQGYTVIGWGTSAVDPTIDPAVDPAVETSVQAVVSAYYHRHLNQQRFTQLKHQINQKLQILLSKLHLKANGFRDRLSQSDNADRVKQEADLLMAHLNQWQPGMQTIALPSFETGEAVTIALNPEKNGIQNAQARYKQHQKLKRSRSAIEPLLAAVQTEINYLAQIETALTQFEDREFADHDTEQDLKALAEIREELIQQGYLADPDYRKPATTSGMAESQPHRYTTPSGFELLIGRNNRQNDQLTFRTAKDYDLWFHSQEIPGSHVLLRLTPGSVTDPKDLQFVADLTAYYSQARQSDQVPVIYTQPKHVYKPKGAKPGTVIYKHEQVIWGYPQRIREQAIHPESSSPDSRS